MGDFGAARQLQRSEWCWLYPQARPPHTQPRAPPPPFRPRRSSLSIDLDGLVDGLLGPSKTPTSPRPRAPRRSPPPPRNPTSRSRAARPKPSPTPDRHPAARGTPGARDPAARDPCRARAGRACGSRPRPVNRSAGPGRRRPGRESSAGPQKPPRRRRPLPPRRRRPPPPLPRPLLVAPQRRRPSPAPAAPRWRPRQRAKPPDRRLCWAWASASLHCPSSPVLWSCGCGASDGADGSSPGRRIRGRNPHRCEIKHFYAL